MKNETFNLTLTIENKNGLEKEATIKIKSSVDFAIYEKKILSFVKKGMVAIKNKKPYISSRSRKSDN